MADHPHRSSRGSLLVILLLLGLMIQRPGSTQRNAPTPTVEVQGMLDSARQAANAGKWEEAGTRYDEAIAKSRAIQDRKGLADALRGRGTIFLSMRKLEKALELYQQALAASREINDRVGEGNSLHNLGLAHSEADRPIQALEFYLPALAIHRETGNKLGEVASLFGIGVCYGNSGQPDKSREYLEQTLPLYRQAGNKKQEALTLGNIGALFYLTGNPQKALENYHLALGIQRETGDKRNEAESLNNIGVVYWDIGQPQQAIGYYELALPIYRENGDKDGQARALGRIGLAYLKLGEPEKSLQYQLQALPLYREAGSPKGEASTLTNLGSICEQTSKFRQAVEYYGQALPLYRQADDRRGEGIALSAMGSSYLHLGELEPAFHRFLQALELSRLVRNKDGESAALSQLGDVLIAQGKPELAAVRYDQAILLTEQLRASLGGSNESKSSYLRTQLMVYYAALRTHLKLRHTDLAFARAQQTKARSLLDLMASGRVDLTRGLTPQEIADLGQLRQEADALNQEMVKEGIQNEVGAKKRFAALQERLQNTEGRLQTLTETLYARHPGLAAKSVATTATLKSVGSALPKDTALLDFVVLSDQDLALFVVTRGKREPVLTAHLLRIDYQKLSARASALHAACADPRKEYRALAEELYSMLLAPAEPQLKSVKRLLICPDGALWDVPFQALLSGKRGSGFLAERFEIAYAYSATGAVAALSARAGRRKPENTLLALANPDFGTSKRFGDLDGLTGQRPIDRPSRPIDQPSRPIDQPSRPIDRPSRPIDNPSRPIDRPSRLIDRPSRAIDRPSRDGLSALRNGRIAPLPGTMREALALRREFKGASVLTGRNAQESTTKQQAGKYRFLHFATHGFFNDTSPLLSSIVLAQPESGSKDDGFLTAREIFDLDLSAEMVVLSACNTARGAQRSGDGVIGLTWALFVSGCPTQVVSQWAVDDASTAKLMEKFYGFFTRNRMGKGAALRQASLVLMRGPKHRHPYYWAPFVLMGDWR